MQKEFLEQEIEKRVIRASPLGKDKNYCRYWFFRRDGRIFVESSDSKLWGFYQTKEEVYYVWIFTTNLWFLSFVT